MPESKSLQPIEPALAIRTLKIEAQGDFWKGITKPKCRLMGPWLERAGFHPGKRVLVTCLAPGVIELRSSGLMTAGETKPPPRQSGPTARFRNGSHQALTSQAVRLDTTQPGPPEP